jgi:hypothetical protein
MTWLQNFACFTCFTSACIPGTSGKKFKSAAPGEGSTGFANFAKLHARAVDTSSSPLRVSNRSFLSQRLNLLLFRNLINLDSELSKVLLIPHVLIGPIINVSGVSGSWIRGLLTP